MKITEIAAMCRREEQRWRGLAADAKSKPMQAERQAQADRWAAAAERLDVGDTTWLR
jgi:hypothetical protein